MFDSDYHKKTWYSELLMTYSGLYLPDSRGGRIVAKSKSVNKE